MLFLEALIFSGKGQKLSLSLQALLPLVVSVTADHLKWISCAVAFLGLQQLIQRVDFFFKLDILFPGILLKFDFLMQDRLLVT